MTDPLVWAMQTHVLLTAGTAGLVCTVIACAVTGPRDRTPNTDVHHYGRKR